MGEHKTPNIIGLRSANWASSLTSDIMTHGIAPMPNENDPE